MVTPNISRFISPLSQTSSCEISDNSGFFDNLSHTNCFSYSDTITQLICVVYAATFLFGFIGNWVVILVLTCKPRMRRDLTNLFILNLAFADLCVIFFCMPINLLTTIYNPWIMSVFLCKAVSYVQGVSVFSSIYSVVAVSLDRCLAIKYPTGECRPANSQKQALITLLVIWLIGMLIYLPWAVVFDVHRDNPTDLPFCQEIWTHKTTETAYLIFCIIFLSFLVPLTLIAILNGIIYRSLKDCTLSRDPLEFREISRGSRIQVLKMLASLTLVFVICWLPLFAVYSLTKLFPGLDENENAVLQIVIHIVRLLGSLNSCLNPVLYAFLNKKFRLAVSSTITAFQRSGTNFASVRFNPAHEVVIIEDDLPPLEIAPEPDIQEIRNWQQQHRNSPSVPSNMHSMQIQRRNQCLNWTGSSRNVARTSSQIERHLQLSRSNIEFSAKTNSL